MQVEHIGTSSAAEMRTLASVSDEQTTQGFFGCWIGI
jgi:hypothetical protein